MADVFMSYSRADRARALAIAAAVEQDGRSLWWDERLPSGADYASVIEREIADASSVVVAWSRTARDSLWVRAEANEALDQGKLVQINLDGAKPPLPFTMLHFIDFSLWSGGREQAPWPQLRSRIDAAAADAPEAQGSGRRPDPGGVPIIVGPEPALQGFGRAAVLGWTALATAALLALCVLMVARRLITADAFGVIAVAAAVVSAVLLALCALTLLRAQRGSRR
jgi:hypothetical protein